MMNSHDGRRKKRDDSVSLLDNDRYNDPSALNPFSPPMNGNIRNRRSPLSGGYSEIPTSLPTKSSVFMSVNEFQDSTSPAANGGGDAHFLELEISPVRTTFPPSRQRTYHHHTTMQQVPKNDNEDLLGMGLEPFRTTSGLQLTHRQIPTQTQPRSTPMPSTDRIPITKNLELDWGFSNGRRGDPYSPQGGENTLEKATRLLGYTRAWIVAFGLVLVIGTATIMSHSHHEQSDVSEMQGAQTLEQIVLVPLPTNATVSRKLLSEEPHLGSTAKPPIIQRALRELRHEFEEWVATHEKKYEDHTEKEKRFQIWTDNHHRTLEKNERHGPCKMTKQPVFGSNMFKDLSPQEFKDTYLTGYKGPKTDEMHSKVINSEQNHRHKRQMRQTSPGSGKVLNPEDQGGPWNAKHRHPSVQARYEEAMMHNRNLKYAKTHMYASGYSACDWYDVSCWLRWLVNKYGYRIGGTMEPSSSAYPSATDWRSTGIVSDVHSQGNCGACWAITAVETIESAYAMSKGTLYDLAETEVIICDDTCDLCEGGWPQNAYEYVMEHKGLPLSNQLAYDGDYLLGLTYAKNGESDEYSESYFEGAVQATCPSDNGGSSQRYGNVKGYGYATDRCICYTDGTGCDCDEQNERLALQNVATYGPATVCLEASLWQDYAGGIITSELGCSAAFLDMNHCVQTVGYAFVDSNSDGEDGDYQDGSGSGSGSGSGDSRDDGDREGYWIIRNQWSENWGMYGYAYVAMGENTCGVLNDMTIVYMK